MQPEGNLPALFPDESPMKQTVHAVVLISANAEWRALFPNRLGDLESPSLSAPSPYGDWFEARVHDHQLVFLHGGWGKVAAAASAEYAISRWHPQRILNLGTCGGFSGLAEPGEILLAEETLIYDIIEQMGDPQEAIRHYISRPTWPEPLPVLPFPVRRVRLVSADRDILSSEIPTLVRNYGAVAADWESGAIAWVVGRHNLPCLILRGVSDLVSAEGGEAYGDLQVFQQRTQEIMRTLVGGLTDIFR